MSITATATAPSVIVPNQTFTVTATVTSTGATTLSGAKLILPANLTAYVSPCFNPGQAIAASTNGLPFDVVIFDQMANSRVIPVNVEITTADGSSCNLAPPIYLTLQPSPQMVPNVDDRSRLLFDRIYIDDVQTTAIGHLAWLC
jgi:hypothetical protein